MFFAGPVCGRNWWLCDGNASYIFVSQDTENNASKLAASKSIQTLQAEITALKAEIKALVRQNLAP